MPNFPGSIDDDASLFLAVNNARTQLSSGITDSDLTIPVVTTSGFPNAGFITILSDPTDITKAEAISYTGVTFTSFSGTLRGAGGTTAFPHNSQDDVDLTVMAEHHNELKDAVIALENIVGPTGSERFVPQDGSGNALVSGTLTVSGLVDFHSDVTVSGIATFGATDNPPTFDSEIIFASQDTEQITISTSFVDANCETTALLNGLDYVVIYTSNLGNSDTVSSNEIKISFGGTKFAGSRHNKATLGTFGDNHYNASICTGVFKVTGDGSSTIKFEFLAASSETSYAGAMAITCIPLDRFTENTDYFYGESTNTDSFTVSNAAVADPPSTVLLNSTLTSIAAGDWLFIWSAELSSGANGRSALARFTVDGNTVGIDRYSWQGIAGGVKSVTAANIVNVPAPTTLDADVLVASTVGALCDFRRGRFFAIKTSLFSQVLSSTDSTGIVTNSSGFTDFTALNTSIVPININAPTIILTSAGSYTLDANSNVTTAIRNETAAVDYRVDAGGRDSVFVGGNGHPQVQIMSSFMSHYEKISVASEYRFQVRSVGGGNVTVGRNDANAGGELAEMIVWEFADASAAAVPITQTIIDDDSIQTGSLLADTINARTSLTVSGIPVNIGAIPFSLPDDITVSGIVATSGIVDNLTAISGTITDLDITDLDAVTGNFTSSLTVSGVPVVTTIPPILFPSKNTLNFTTLEVSRRGGSREVDQLGFNNRSVVRKFKITPNAVQVEAFQVDFYRNSNFLPADLEYRATASGIFIDNFMWFHEDEDNTGAVHVKIINSGSDDSTFSIELTSEALA